MINIRLLVQVILLIAQGIFEALRSARRFEELEEKIQRLVQRAALILLEEASDQVDRRLCAARDVKRLKVIGLRSRTIVTSFGELSFKRRLYFDIWSIFPANFQKLLEITKKSWSGLRQLCCNRVTADPF